MSERKNYGQILARYESDFAAAEPLLTPEEKFNEITSGLIERLAIHDATAQTGFFKFFSSFPEEPKEDDPKVIAFGGPIYAVQASSWRNADLDWIQTLSESSTPPETIELALKTIKANRKGEKAKLGSNLPFTVEDQIDIQVKHLSVDAQRYAELAKNGAENFRDSESTEDEWTNFKQTMEAEKNRTQTRTDLQWVDVLTKIAAQKATLERKDVKVNPESVVNTFMGVVQRRQEALR